ncbi:MAG: hypothetical protein ABJA67_06775 [Chthonomonadales bacterium]
MGTDHIHELVRTQTVSMLDDCLNIRIVKNDEKIWNLISDKNWPTIMAKIQKLKPVWDEAKGRFVATNPN